MFNIIFIYLFYLAHREFQNSWTSDSFPHDHQVVHQEFDIFLCSDVDADSAADSRCVCGVDALDSSLGKTISDARDVPVMFKSWSIILYIIIYIIIYIYYNIYIIMYLNISIILNHLTRQNRLKSVYTRQTKGEIEGSLGNIRESWMRSCVA